MVLQCTASILKEQIKVCVSCEGFGNRLCFLETTSNAQVQYLKDTGVICATLVLDLTICFVLQNVPPDLAICCFILEQSLSVRALQEMLSNTSLDEVRQN